MPTYDYKCKACGKVVEVFHNISEIDNPSEATIEKTSCPYDRDCIPNLAEKIGMEIPTENDLRFEHCISSPVIMGTYGGSSLSGAEKRATIHKERKERSRKDFKENIYPTLPKQEKKHFDKKWKKEGRN